MISNPLPNKPLPPIEEVAFSFNGIELQLSVQRNDLIHPLISGNKWRKLQAFVEQESQGLMSFGGAWSNHLLAIAALGRMLDKPTVGWIRGDESRKVNHYERWLQQLGMKLHYLSREEYKDKAACQQKVRMLYPNFQLIPEGGEPQPHFAAFDNWLEEIPLHFSHFLLSCGSGATLIGMCKALQLRPREVQLVGIHAVNMSKEINRLTAASQAIWPNAQVIGSPDGKRFGKLSPKRFAMSKAFFEQTGIAPDPVYDASVLLWYAQAVFEGQIPHGSKVLWLHSGGITGWAGYASECQELFGL